MTNSRVRFADSEDITRREPILLAPLITTPASVRNDDSWEPTRRRASPPFLVIATADCT